ncbi:Protein of unknown function [Alteribacillus persepolensis]|uniref:DUF1510 domain-containing protein n=2 Tax=Alteribacillus persepolensis TaxID=568899 RepID=A0A1G8DKW0_9BACI|nr:Protein of unknown function [Alteribacillus persepolensis]
MNRILNGSIVAVGALILFFAAQLFFSGNEQAEEESPPSETIDAEPAEETAPQTESNEDTQNEDNREENQEDEDREDGDRETEEGISIPEGGGENGNFEPIGTEQTGSFEHNFTEGSQNWKEMKAALRYAAGLTEAPEEEIEFWRIENGGGSHTVVGVLSHKSHHDRPYRVTMEFIENEGWKPLEVEQLDSNPYY